MRRTSTYTNIPATEKIDEVAYTNGITLKASDLDVVLHLSETVGEDQTSMVMVPFYHESSSLYSIIGGKYPDHDQASEDMVSGDIHELREAKKDVDIIKLNDKLELMLFVYTHAMKKRPAMNSNNIGTLNALFEHIAEALRERPLIEHLIVPVFGTNNGFSFSTVSFMIFYALSFCIQEDTFKGTGLKCIEICAPSRFPATRAIEHFKHLLFLKDSSSVVCPICTERQGTMFFIECGHSGLCNMCATRGAMNTRYSYECPFCKITGHLCILSRNSTGSGERRFTSPCGHTVVNSNVKPSGDEKCCDDCKFIELFDVAMDL